MSKEEKKKPQVSGLMSILLSAGFTAALAIAITEATSEEERIPEFLKKEKTPIIFMTKMDSKVDDKICLPLEGTVWDKDESNRPQIPSSTHPNCRCFYIDAVTGQNLGQI